MSPTILLARPYPFLVDEMKSFLEQDGYSVDKVSPDGAELDMSGYAGAVIALAAVSELKIEPGEVLTRLRHADPAIPVVFAGLLPLSSYESTLVCIAEEQGMTARLLGVQPDCENAPELGQPEGFVYIQRDNLGQDDERGRTLAMLRKHLG